MADIWDALSNDRPYRKSWTPRRVIDYIASLSGTALDPNLVATFLRLHAAGLIGDLEQRSARPFAEADDQAPGVGASTLEAEEPATTPPALPAIPPPMAPELREALKVLIADADSDSAANVVGMLERMGHEAVVATSGQSTRSTCP